MMDGSVKDGGGRNNDPPDRTLEEAEEHITELQKKLANKHRFPRGTSDSVEVAAAAASATENKVNEKEVRDRLHAAVVLRPDVEEILKGGSHAIKEITSLLKQTNNAVADVISTLRAEDRVYNMGTAERPLWTLRIGLEASTDDLRATITRLIAERPMTTVELSDATGSTEHRVAIALAAIRRVARVFSTGAAKKPRWFRIPEDARVVVQTRPARRVRRPTG